MLLKYKNAYSDNNRKVKNAAATTLKLNVARRSTIIMEWLIKHALWLNNVVENRVLITIVICPQSISVSDSFLFLQTKLICIRMNYVFLLIGYNSNNFSSLIISNQITLNIKQIQPLLFNFAIVKVCKILYKCEWQ